MSERLVAVGSARIAVRSVGRGPTVVLVPGLAGRGSFWQPLIRALQPEFRVVTYDHRGAGRSSSTDTRYSMHAMTADLLSVLDRCVAEPAVLIGHSTGGAIAQRVALGRPGAVSQLVLCSTWARPCDYFRDLFGLRLQILETLGVAAYRRHSSLLMYPPRWLAQRRRLSRMRAAGGGSALSRRILGRKLRALLTHDVQDRLPEIRCPTLIMVAADDVVTPPHLSEAIARGIPEARLAILPEGGHFVLQVDPAAYIAEIVSFLRPHATARG